MYKAIFPLVFIIFSLLSVGSSAASLSAEVDRESLAANESLRLIVSLDQNTSNNIDFSELELQFEIVNRQRSNQTSIVNGKITTSTQWILILIPKESGKLLIPSFELDGIYSQAIPINVATNQSKQASRNQEVLLEASVNKSSIYVQEQVLLTLRLYYRTPLASYDAENISLPNTTLELVAENNFSSKRNGESYTVLEKIYALHPQASGELIIPAQSWRLEKAANRFNFGRSGVPYLFARSEPITISVLPINDNSQAITWLPSSALTLDAQWRDSIIKAKVGEPISLQVVMIANGLAAAQLPNIELNSNQDFTIYSEQANIDDNKSRIGIIGTRINNFAIIPKRAGSFTFPAIEVKWWNIDEDREEIASIKEQTIIVNKGALSDNTSTAFNQTLPQTNAAQSTGQEQRLNWIWPFLSAVFLIICLALLFIVLKQRRLLSTSPAQTDPEAIDKNKSFETISEKKLRQAFALAQQENDLKQIRHLAIRYVKEVVNDANISTLQDIANYAPEIKETLSDFDRALYGSERSQTTSAFNPDDFIEIILNLKADKKKSNKQTHLSEFTHF